MKKVLLYLLKFYKTYISCMLPNCCRFYPTCSEYCYIAIAKYGVLKGLFLGIKRILKCNPFFKGGYDPLN